MAGKQLSVNAVLRERIVIYHYLAVGASPIRIRRLAQVDPAGTASRARVANNCRKESGDRGFEVST